MRVKEMFENVFKGMGNSITRYPLTVLFLIGVAVLNGMMIERVNDNYTRQMLTLVVGGMLSVVGQTLYERFSTNKSMRYGLMGVAVVLTIAYYFAVGPQLQYDQNVIIKTSVALFSLVIAFIWIPSIKNEFVSFHRSFLSVVKAFFTSLLFSIVLSLGFSAIFSATDYLLFDVDYDILSHVLNIVASLFAPIYFLSMTPDYGLINEEAIASKAVVAEKVENQFNVPRFLEILLSYIIIPLLAAYTFILILYVLLNITGDFWTNNLLEPLLVSFAVIGIIVLILSYTIENRFAVTFRKVFPKILLPVVVFQTVASILKIGEMGITHGRYYVILFGIFATIAGIIFSFMKPDKHGYIAAVILVLATISIVPPIDAFTISKNNQINLLEETLAKNNMLSDDTIVANPEAPMEDRVAITSVMSYITSMGYEDEVSFLPAGYEVYRDFNETFGFNMTYSVDHQDPSPRVGEYAYFDQEENYIYEVAGFDRMSRQYLYYNVGEETEILEDITFEVEDESYTLTRQVVDDYYTLAIVDSSGTELIVYSTEELFTEVFGEESTSEFVEYPLAEDEAIFETENDNVRLNFILTMMERGTDYRHVEFYLLIDIKD